MAVGLRRVLITGATDGIGLLMAQRLYDAGWVVMATGRKPLAHPETIFGERDITYIRADQSEPQTSGIRIVQAMRSLGWDRCDLVILNAGVGYVGDPTQEKVQSIEEQVAVNVQAPVQIAHAVAPFLFAAGGQLTFIGSVAHKGAAKFATYSATKAAIHGLVRSLREEWRGRAHVQIIHPGS